MIKRYFATKDNTITNAFQENLQTRGTGSNMGASDILEVFSIRGQETSGSTELSRVLIQFDTNEISTDRSAGDVPASGSVKFFLKMYNAPHSQTVPRDYKMSVFACSASWEEGYGLDMEEYSDLTDDEIGSNWIRKSGSTSWAIPGGTVHTGSLSEDTFETGLEDLEVDVTDHVERWLKGMHTNAGFHIRLSSSFEAQFSGSQSQQAAGYSGSVPVNMNGSTRSYYTKRFFGRTTEFHFKKPVLEARFNDTKQDDRGNFYFSSSIAQGDQNKNTLFLYNYVRGRLRDIPVINQGNIFVKLYSGSTAPVGNSITQTFGSTTKGAATGSHVSTGIYSCDVCLTGNTTNLSKIFDVWYSSTGTEYFTGSITPKDFSSQGFRQSKKYVLSMPNLQEQYFKGETALFRLYVREKNWSPNIFTVASSTRIPSTLIESASFQLKRCVDSEVVVSYGTGSLKHTGLSYDVTGNYFKLDTSYLESGYQYELSYVFFNEDSNSYVEQPHRFKFRVVDDEY